MCVDIGIITIREDEYSAVLLRLKNPKIEQKPHRTYVLADLRHRSGVVYNVGLVRAVEQGPNSGQDTARDLIEDLDPQWIAVVGIGGAIPQSDFTLGDVVVASRLHDFTVGAHTEGKAEFADQGGPMSKVIQDLVATLEALRPKLRGWESESSITVARPAVDRAASNFYGSDEWRLRTSQSLERFFGDSPLRSFPEITSKAVASSGTLVKDPDLVATWQSTARDLALVEMELGGIYFAARRRTREYPILAVRGISDIVGFKRSPEWTQYACHTAAAALIAILQNLPNRMLIARSRQRRKVAKDPIATEASCAELKNASESGTPNLQIDEGYSASHTQPAIASWIGRFGNTWRDILFTPIIFFKQNTDALKYTGPWLFYLVSSILVYFALDPLFFAFFKALDPEIPTGAWVDSVARSAIQSLIPSLSMVIMSVVIVVYASYSRKLIDTNIFRSFYRVFCRFLYAIPVSSLMASLSVAWFLACIFTAYIVASSLPSPKPMTFDEMLTLLNEDPTIFDTFKEYAIVIIVLFLLFGPLIFSILFYPTVLIKSILNTTRLRAFAFATVITIGTMIVVAPINLARQQGQLSMSERNATHFLRQLSIVSASFKEKNNRYGSLVELKEFSRLSFSEDGGKRAAALSPMDREALTAVDAVDLQEGVSGYNLSFKQTRIFAYVNAIPQKYSDDTHLSFLLLYGCPFAYVSDRRGRPAIMFDEVVLLWP